VKLIRAGCTQGPFTDDPRPGVALVEACYYPPRLLVTNGERTLEEMRICSFGRLVPELVWGIAAQGFTLLSRLHASGYVIRNISPTSFVLRDGRLLLIDATTSRIAQRRTNILRAERNSRISPLLFSSAAVQLGLTHDFEDDRLAFAYVLLHLLNGELPWKPWNTPTEILKAKQSRSLADLFQSFPFSVKRHLMISPMLWMVQCASILLLVLVIVLKFALLHHWL